MSAIRQLASRLVRINPKLRGLKLDHQGNTLTITMRVAGMTRYYIQGDAKDLIIKFIRSARIPVDKVKLELATTEINGRQLYLGEGRTEMSKRPRASRKADGSRWDDYEWWGEDLVGQGDGGVGVGEMDGTGLISRGTENSNYHGGGER